MYHMNDHRPFRVLVTLQLSNEAGRMRLNGLHRFLSEGYDWDLELLRTKWDFLNSEISTQPLTYDGYFFGVSEMSKLDSARKCQVRPVVFVDYPDDSILKESDFTVFIHNDDNEIAKEVLRNILPLHKIKSFGFVPSRSPARWSTERHKSLSERMRKAGHDLIAYEESGNDRQALANWLVSLQRPACVVAAYDDRARDVADACRDANLRIPDDITLLGIGNDEQVCEMQRPELSSVAIDFEQEGYRAARELQAMMIARRKPARHEIRCGVKGTILRTSLPGNTVEALVKRAHAYIERHALEGIDVRDVVSHLRISRRLADLRFREGTGTTILEAILSKRLEEVSRLLRNTKLPMSEIASLCGYRDANYLKNLFKSRFGQSMREYRQSHTDIRESARP